MLQFYNKVKKEFLGEPKYIHLLNAFLIAASNNCELLGQAWQWYLQAEKDGIADNITFTNCIKLHNRPRHFRKVTQIAKSAEAAEKLENAQNTGAEKTRQRDDAFFGSLITAFDRVENHTFADSEYTTALGLGVANKCTVAAYIKHCINRKDFSAAKKVFDSALKRGDIDSNSIDEYIKACRAKGYFPEARRASKLAKSYDSRIPAAAQPTPLSSPQPYSMYDQYGEMPPMQGLSPAFPAYPYASPLPMFHSSPGAFVPPYEEEFFLRGDSKRTPAQSFSAQAFDAPYPSSVYGNPHSASWQMQAHPTYFSQMGAYSQPYFNSLPQYRFSNYKDALASMDKSTDTTEILSIYKHGPPDFPHQAIQFVNKLLVKSTSMPELFEEAWRQYEEAQEARIANSQTYESCSKACIANNKPDLNKLVKQHEDSAKNKPEVSAYPSASHNPSPQHPSASAGEACSSSLSPLPEGAASLLSSPSPTTASSSTYSHLRKSSIRSRSPEPADTDSATGRDKRRKVDMQTPSLRRSPTASSESSVSSSATFFGRTASGTPVGASMSSPAPTPPREQQAVNRNRR